MKEERRGGGKEGREEVVVVVGGGRMEEKGFGSVSGSDAEEGWTRKRALDVLGVGTWIYEGVYILMSFLGC